MKYEGDPNQSGINGYGEKWLDCIYFFNRAGMTYRLCGVRERNKMTLTFLFKQIIIIFAINWDVKIST